MFLVYVCLYIPDMAVSFKLKKLFRKLAVYVKDDVMSNISQRICGLPFMTFRSCEYGWIDVYHICTC